MSKVKNKQATLQGLSKEELEQRRALIENKVRIKHLQKAIQNKQEIITKQQAEIANIKRCIANLQQR